jgi:hypothetical protein
MVTAVEVHPSIVVEVAGRQTPAGAHQIECPIFLDFLEAYLSPEAAGVLIAGATKRGERREEQDQR